MVWSGSAVAVRLFGPALQKPGKSTKCSTPLDSSSVLVSRHLRTAPVNNRRIRSGPSHSTATSLTQAGCMMKTQLSVQPAVVQEHSLESDTDLNPFLFAYVCGTDGHRYATSIRTPSPSVPSQRICKHLSSTGCARLPGTPLKVSGSRLS